MTAESLQADNWTSMNSVGRSTGWQDFLATIEHFRRTGTVARRISGASYVEQRIMAPRHGSFIQDVLIQTAAGVSTASFLAFLAYVWHIILPRREKTDSVLLEIARLNLQSERERTKQSREMTQQLRIAKSISDGERASAQQAVQLLEWSLEIPEDFQATLTASSADRSDMLREVQSEQEREAEFSEAEGALNEINEDALDRLTSRLRPMIPEIALPLRNSATRMSVGSEKPDHQQLMHITQEIVGLVQSRRTEKTLTTFVGHIKAYDRDSGVGKVWSESLPRVLNFVVPQNKRLELRDSVLAGMRQNLVTMTCRRVLDDSDQPTSLILVSPVILSHEDPKDA